jgi:hypothetical protein
MATTGTPPYTYDWSTGDHTPSVYSLSAGTYSVTVHDGAGCIASANVVVNPSGGTAVSITTDQAIICSGDSAKVCAPSGYVSYQWNTSETTACIYAHNPGNYYVTVTDNGNCTATSNHLSIAIHPLPPTSISVRGDTLTAYNAISYQWYYNGSPIPGATSHIYIATQAGNYSVAVTDSNGCSATSNPTPIILGVNQLGSDEQIEVYPNPLASGNWQISAGPAWLGSRYEIYDAEGRIIYRDEIRDVKSTLKLDVPRGIYLMKIAAEHNSYTIKLTRL